MKRYNSNFFKELVNSVFSDESPLLLQHSHSNFHGLLLRCSESWVHRNSASGGSKCLPFTGLGLHEAACKGRFAESAEKEPGIAYAEHLFR
jgi:hypothetical protein